MARSWLRGGSGGAPRFRPRNHNRYDQSGRQDAKRSSGRIHPPGSGSRSDRERKYQEDAEEDREHHAGGKGRFDVDGVCARLEALSDLAAGRRDAEVSDLHQALTQDSFEHFLTRYANQRKTEPLMAAIQKGLPVFPHDKREDIMSRLEKAGCSFEGAQEHKGGGGARRGRVRVRGGGLKTRKPAAEGSGRQQGGRQLGKKKQQKERRPLGDRWKERTGSNCIHVEWKPPNGAEGEPEESKKAATETPLEGAKSKAAPARPPSPVRGPAGRGMSSTQPAWMTRNSAADDANQSAPEVGAGRGRGRDMTLPSWQTGSSASGPPPRQPSIPTFSNEPARPEGARDETTVASSRGRERSPPPWKPSSSASGRYSEEHTRSEGAMDESPASSSRGRDRTLPPWQTSPSASEPPSQFPLEPARTRSKSRDERPVASSRGRREQQSDEAPPPPKAMPLRKDRVVSQSSKLSKELGADPLVCSVHRCPRSWDRLVLSSDGSSWCCRTGEECVVAWQPASKGATSSSSGKAKAKSQTQANTPTAQDGNARRNHKTARLRNAASDLMGKEANPGDLGSSAASSSRAPKNRGRRQSGGQPDPPRTSRQERLSASAEPDAIQEDSQQRQHGKRKASHHDDSPADRGSALRPRAASAVPSLRGPSPQKAAPEEPARRHSGRDSESDRRQAARQSSRRPSREEEAAPPDKCREDSDQLRSQHHRHKHRSSQQGSEPVRDATHHQQPEHQSPPHPSQPSPQQQQQQHHSPRQPAYQLPPHHHSHPHHLPHQSQPPHAGHPPHGMPIPQGAPPALPYPGYPSPQPYYGYQHHGAYPAQGYPPPPHMVPVVQGQPPPRPPSGQQPPPMTHPGIGPPPSTPPPQHQQVAHMQQQSSRIPSRPKKQVDDEDL
mmetsp:Transcript_62067/g.148031  ORF Transcript_62067/g.148031 Transcript_62067/m.148031 type:complete len:894 (+) Transcript_62067:88-2769(+)